MKQLIDIVIWIFYFFFKILYPYNRLLFISTIEEQFSAITGKIEGSIV